MAPRTCIGMIWYLIFFSCKDPIYGLVRLTIEVEAPSLLLGGVSWGQAYQHQMILYNFAPYLSKVRVQHYYVE